MGGKVLKLRSEILREEGEKSQRTFLGKVILNKRHIDNLRK